jgi:hypothetical protein
MLPTAKRLHSPTSHAMTKSELRAMNNLKDGAALVTGQILQVLRKKRRSHSLPALPDPLERSPSACVASSLLSSLLSPLLPRAVGGTDRPPSMLLQTHPRVARQQRR